MTHSSRSERETQDRVIQLFTDPDHPHYLGYEKLGNWQRRENNRNIEAGLLTQYLTRRGYTGAQISRALQRLERAADATGITLYQANMRTYQLLRYGVEVQTAAGKKYETVQLIDWENPEKNDFGLAEEVTLKGGHERRPDIVLYINGIAVGVIELKRSSVDIGDGIAQLRTNQEEIFNKDFFSTVQFVFAGNDSQGLKYGTTDTKAKYFLTWKEKDERDGGVDTGFDLDTALARMCGKERFTDLIYNCVVYDAGIKKVPRSHQYIGFKKAQERIRKREGGVIWHTQGSGKSILMVLLAKWIREYDPKARVLIITDRDELDKQIEGVMRNAGVIGEEEPPPRIANRREFVSKVSATRPWLMCALIHKFDPDLDNPPPDIHGQFYIFVDECHRTQGGEMNRQMKRWMKNGIFIGFTGTPLLKKDKQTTRQVFGTYIHTYKFGEAVRDKVVLDLKYEARAVPQRLGSRKEVDEWFQGATKGLNKFQQAVLRQRWATLEELMSSEDRKSRIVASIIHDFMTRRRLNNNRGTAILVAASIYDACHYFRLFRAKDFGQYCGIVTSYVPQKNLISKEPKNSDERYKYDTYMNFVLEEGQSVKDYEDRIKVLFREEPANCKLLIVVSKLLTGFDAPSCTYLYLDNQMKDHTLFQAICRTNRLDGEDKDFGYIVDFKELYENLQKSISVYSSDELDIDDDGDDGNVKVKNWLEEGKKILDTARDALKYLCDPVDEPKQLEQYLQYFCGRAEREDALEATEQLRITFYRLVVTFLRSYATISGELEKAGYTNDQIARLKEESVFFTEVREAIKKHSGEELDIKPYEAEMRYLINTYIQADIAETIGELEEMSLTELIIETGIHDAIARKLNAENKLSRNSVSEAIINNIRKTINRDRLTDPRFYSKMSALLADLIRQQRQTKEEYEAFLRRAEELVKRMAGKQSGGHPAKLDGKPEAVVLYQNLDGIESDTFQCPEDEDEKADTALALDRVMKEEAPAGWKTEIEGPKGRQILNAIYPIMGEDAKATMAIFELIKNQPGY